MKQQIITLRSRDGCDSIRLTLTDDMKVKGLITGRNTSRKTDSMSEVADLFCLFHFLRKKKVHFVNLIVCDYFCVHTVNQFSFGNNKLLKTV